MDCSRCQNQNLTDYPVCPTCSQTAHFTNRPCLCASCDLPAIHVTYTGRGVYEFRLPFKNNAFLADFETRIGKRWRCWHIQRAAWQITPADDQMIDYLKAIIETHFKNHVVVVRLGDNTAAQIAA